MGHFSEGSRPITEEVVVVGVGSVNHLLRYHFHNTTITWVHANAILQTWGVYVQSKGVFLHMVG